MGSARRPYWAWNLVAVSVFPSIPFSRVFRFVPMVYCNRQRI